MSKVITIIGAGLLAVGLSAASFAQTGGNPQAPEPNSSGTGITKGSPPTPGDATMSKGKMSKKMKNKKSMKSGM
jgi:hypothetical protein